MSMTQLFTSRRLVFSLAGILIGSTLLTMAAPTSSHALSLSDVTGTVSTVTQNIPIVRDLPLIGQGGQSGSGSTTTTTPQTTTPTTTTQQTVPSTSSPTQATTDEQQTTPTTTSQPSSTASSQTAAVVATPSSSLASVPLTSEQNQAMIAAAIGKDPIQKLSYDTKKLDATTANVLFYGGIAGMAAGGYALYALRPKNA